MCEKIQFMPMERHNTELISLLNSLPEPVLAIDMKGHVDMANHAALSLFNCEQEEMIGHPIVSLLPNFNFSNWTEGKITRHREDVVIGGLDYSMEVMPVYITAESNESVLASTVMIIRSNQENLCWWILYPFTIT